MSYYTSIKNSLKDMWFLTRQHPELTPKAAKKLAVADRHLVDALRYLQCQIEKKAQGKIIFGETHKWEK